MLVRTVYTKHLEHCYCYGTNTVIYMYLLRKTFNVTVNNFALFQTNAEFTQSFYRGSCCSLFSLLYSVLLTIGCLAWSLAKPDLAILFWLSYFGYPDLAILYMLFGFFAPKTLNYFAFHLFDFERTWWMLFQKRIVRIKLDIYGFIICIGHCIVCPLISSFWSSERLLQFVVIFDNILTQSPWGKWTPCLH